MFTAVGKRPSLWQLASSEHIGAHKKKALSISDGWPANSSLPAKHIEGKLPSNNANPGRHPHRETTFLRIVDGNLSVPGLLAGD